MCGIVGFLNKNTHNHTHKIADSAKLIATMTDRLAHRGPNDGSTWINQKAGIALGHRRLSIIDLSSTGKQPMHSQNGDYIIVYNGEIYNFIELKKQLTAKNHHFYGQSDTEVILALISEYGFETALQRMSGMFALALWDNKNKTLSLARDRIGEKPLYYGIINNTFVFGSELKALQAYPNFNNPINRKSLMLFMQYGYVPTPHSIYEEIYKLTPGTTLTISASTLHTLPTPKTYWSAIDIAQTNLANNLELTDVQAIETTDQLLNAIIQKQMIADVPIGAFLSGGIDSSLIAALMQANSSQPIKTFTIGFHDQAYNEAHFAKAIAKHLHTDHTEFYVDAQQALSIIPQLPSIYDEPFADSSAIPTILLAQLTKQQVSVCLSGDGGDEIFGGYNRYLLAQTLWQKLSYLPYHIRLSIQKLLLSISPSRWHQLLKFTTIPMIGDKLHKFASIVAIKSPALFYQQLISQWPNANNLVKNQIISNHQTLLQEIESMNFIEKMMITDTISYLPDDIMVKIDRATMAVSLESRAPYLDHQLIELMWKLPLHMKIRNSTSKWLLRQILYKYVPQHLIDRPKMGFGIPLDVWLRGPLRDWAESLLNKALIEQQGYLQAAPILEKWQEHLSGKRNWQYQLWTVLMFQAWMTK